MVSNLFYFQLSCFINTSFINTVLSNQQKAPAATGLNSVYLEHLNSAVMQFGVCPKPDLILVIQLVGCRHDNNARVKWPK